MPTDKSYIAKSINPLLKGKKTNNSTLAVDTSHIATKISEGSITELSRGITLIESTNPKHQEQAQSLIEACMPTTGTSLRIGITGVPGVGKSTFIEAFGMYLIREGYKVAVLAVDPTSSISHGSILGDKTRMYELSQNKNAFIRPSASGDSLGGVARKTRETIMLCEAAGYDMILIETVGVGQSETAVHSMTDFFLLLKLAGAGDELQGIKRGIIEMADAIVINKADGENVKAATIAQSAFKKALHLFPPKPSNWTPKVSTCSAIDKTGIDQIWQYLKDYKQKTQASGYFTEHRAEQNMYWLRQTIEQKLKDNFFLKPEVKELLPNYLEAVSKEKMSPFIAAQELLKL